MQQWAFSGVSTFAHLKHVKCLVDSEVAFDIGILGAPFDTAVSYRPGQSLSSFCTLISSLEWHLKVQNITVRNMEFVWLERVH